MKLHSPVSFRPYPVTILSVLVYLALGTLLLYVHHRVPSPKPLPDIDLDEAWHDLQHLTSAFHPFNSHQNDIVRDWLLTRIGQLLPARSLLPRHQVPLLRNDTGFIHVIADSRANISYGVPDSNRREAYSAYFESRNIIVYIRGREDDPSNWWLSNEDPKDPQGVLLNAHFDSVSTGYGASDDGVGVVSVLQLIKYYSRHRPRHGIIALLNNGEEDDLYGARVFQHHPLSRLAQYFVNLEGAGAGGRAVLFRSTDTGVTRAYERVPRPFGSVINADAFRRGLIKSETDYRVFSQSGMRGLDIAFMAPRARYHTDEDDTRHTSRASVYHMLSAALESSRFLANRQAPDTGDDAVWFDLLGRTFAVFQHHTLFALQITILVVSPFCLLLIGTSLRQMDRKYLFAGSKNAGDETVSVKGRRGLFRWPLAFLLSFAGVGALAMATVKLNAFIIYSSVYAVWGMFLSAWILIAWLCLRFADYLRPTAFQRTFCLLWMFTLGWIVQLLAVISGLASAYLVFFYFCGIFLATAIALMEVWGLPRKTVFAEEVIEDDEETSLLHGRHIEEAYGAEQAWSHALPSGLWILEFLLMVFPMLLIGQVALIVSAALPQTLADGSDVQVVYGAVVLLAIILLVPSTPFLHRVSFVVPLVCAVVLAGTVLYNLTAFPFSANNRFKVYFQQQVDLDTGTNNASLTGSAQYLQQVIESLPSAAHVDYTCERGRAGLASCMYPGLEPQIGEMDFSITREDGHRARFRVRGTETRACTIRFDHPITDYEIDGSDPTDDRVDKIGQKGGSHRLKLWSRSWNRTWEGSFEWVPTQKTMSGRVVCLWSEAGRVPALEEAWRYAPAWVAVTKRGDGLVEAGRSFSV